VLNKVRTINGTLSPGTEIASDAMWEHQLGFRNMAEWAPLLKPIVEFSNFRQTPQGAIIQGEMLNFSMRISVHYEDMVSQLERMVGPIRDWSNLDSESNSEESSS